MADEKELIQPRTLKGFRDYLPALAIPREQMIDTARRVFRSYGFAPIDTPALEYAEILAGKGGDESDRQMYRFQDHGGREVALRFDLTVPFARFAAQHIHELGTPFKRYHVGPAWRGENPQHGRYREFYQCDFDTIGTESVAADIETVLLIHDLVAALGFAHFAIRVNDRRVLNGLLQQSGLGERSAPVLRALDKLAKIGPDKVVAEMAQTAQVAPEQGRAILETVQVQGRNLEVLRQLQARLGGHELAGQGLDSLHRIHAACAAAGIEDHVRIDASLARGLDYYTGTVYETYLDRLPQIGSICSGGRYDELAGLYTRQHLPGVGASLGLDRLMAAMEELGLLRQASTPASVFVVQFAAESLHRYLGLARRLRQAGIGTELFPEALGVGRQLKYADRKGHLVAVIGGPDEAAKGTWQVKVLQSGESAEVSDAEVVEYLKRRLEELRKSELAMKALAE